MIYLKDSKLKVRCSDEVAGEPDPSDEDMRVTKQIFEAGQILGINMLDHIILTDTGFYSFKENREWKK